MSVSAACCDRKAVCGVLLSPVLSVKTAAEAGYRLSVLSHMLVDTYDVLRDGEKPSFGPN